MTSDTEQQTSLETRHLGTRIERPSEVVYAYASDPRNLHDWAAGLADAEITEDEDGHWFADSPMGRVQVAFAPPNAFGILDHDVTLPDGTVVTNPLRVLADGEASDVVFSVRRRPEVSADDYERDVAAIETDLATLKRVLEAGD